MHTSCFKTTRCLSEQRPCPMDRLGPRARLQRLLSPRALEACDTLWQWHTCFDGKHACHSPGRQGPCWPVQTAARPVASREGQRTWSDVLTVLKGNKQRPRLRRTMQLSSEKEGEIETVPDKQNLRVCHQQTCTMKFRSTYFGQRESGLRCKRDCKRNGDELGETVTFIVQQRVTFRRRCNLGVLEPLFTMRSIMED